MSTAIWKRLPLLAILALPVPLLGCSVAALFDARGVPETEISSTGVQVLSDTQSNWERWKLLIDIQIDRESKGMAVDKAFGSSWRGFWMQRFQSLRKNRTNPDRYINYIIAERRARGLPEL